MESNQPEEIKHIERDGSHITDKDILNDLCNKAHAISPEVRDCIRAYKLDASTKSLTSLFDNQFKKGVLVQTLSFLSPNPTQDWDDYKKKACIHELICCIQNLLIDTCQFCTRMYAIQVHEKSLLRCSVCGQGVHNECLKDILGSAYSETMTADDVMKIINPLSIETMKFMCSQCLVRTIPQSNAGLKDSVVKSNSLTNQKVPEVPSPEDNTDSSPSSIIPPNLSDDLLSHSELVCNDYVKGQCPHGMSGKTLVDGEVCRFTHPKRCRKFCTYGPNSKFGCNRKDCKYFHSKLCKYSVQIHLCTNLYFC